MKTLSSGRPWDLGRTGRTVTGLAGSVLLLGVLLSVLGVDGVVSDLQQADRLTVVAVVGVTVCVLVVRGIALRLLLCVLGHEVSIRRGLGIYLGTTFVNTIAPGGQAGGAPVSGLLVARSADAEYEDGVATVVAISALSNLVVGSFGVVGVGYLLVTMTGSDVTLLAVAAVCLFGVAVLGLVGLWRVRERVRAVTVTLVAAALRTVARFLPGATRPGRDAVEGRVDRFGDALARLRAGSRRQVAALVGLLALAHALTVVALWLSFVAIGQSVSVGVLLAVIPAAVVAAVLPSPGGAGGVDIALVGLIASSTSAVASAAGAAVLVYRTATSGPALLAGGGVVVTMGALGWIRDADEET